MCFVKADVGCSRLPDQSQHKATIYPCVFHTWVLMDGFPLGGCFHRPMSADKNVFVMCICVWLQLKGFPFPFWKVCQWETVELLPYENGLWFWRVIIKSSRFYVSTGPLVSLLGRVLSLDLTRLAIPANECLVST